MKAERKLRTAEQERLLSDGQAWKHWGPYLSERQWGTVREDYSDNGDAWNYFTHDQARSRAYHWGEDGLAGISDNQQRLCFALALWNGKDPILKERLFGLTNSEGNHGEDVKEYYFYLDSTPTHSYMKYLYKYPQAAFPYDDLVETNRAAHPRAKWNMNCWTPASSTKTGTSMYSWSMPRRHRKTCSCRSPCAIGDPKRRLHVLPTLWFRNTWAMAGRDRERRSEADQGPRGPARWRPRMRTLAISSLLRGEVPLLFTENETNNERLFRQPNPSPYVKDGINNYVVHGQQDAVNPEQTGTKVVGALST